MQRVCVHDGTRANVSAAEPRVLFVVGSLDVGGAERHLADIVPALQRQGVRAMVGVISGRGEMATALEGQGVTVVTPPLAERLRTWPKVLRRALLMPLSVVSLAVLIRRTRPDIVHFFLPEAYLIGGLVTSVFPVPIRVMSCRSLNVYQQKHPLAFRLERWLHKRMTAVLGNSRAVVDQLRVEGVDPDRLGLIYNGIDIADFAANDRPVIREALGIPDDSLVMAVVANLIAYKGHTDLIEALGRIASQLPPGWRLLCIGDDRGIGGSLRERARDLGIGEHLLWLGYRADARGLLGAADIGIFAPTRKGSRTVCSRGWLLACLW